MYAKKWSKKYSSPRVLEKVLQMLKSALAKKYEQAVVKMIKTEYTNQSL